MKERLLWLFVVGLSLFSCQGPKDVIKNSKGSARSTPELDAFFNSLVDTLEIPGISVAIINQSEIVYHSHFGVNSLENNDALNEQTIFEAASLSKPVFAYFAMKQVEKGLLDLDKPLYEYLPYPDIEYDERYQLITARMILSHSAGFPNWRQDSLTIEFLPGSNYMYSGEGYAYLARVLAEVNQVPFDQLDSIFQVEVSNPIKARRMYYQWNDDITLHKATGHINNQPTTNSADYKDNEFGAAGGLHTDVKDYAQFLISIFDNLLISEELKSEMLQQQIKLPEDDINQILIGATGWSLGFGMIPVGGEVCYFHGGNNDDFQSWMHFYPEKGYGLVLFSNSDKIQSPEFFELFFGFMDDGINFDFSKLN